MDAVIENMRSTLGSGVRKMFSNNNQAAKNNGNDKASSDTQNLKMSLRDICEREGSTIPFIVRDICKFISQRSMKVEGIFRVSASVRLLNELRNSYESNTNFRDDLLLNRDDTTEIIAHAAAGLLKKFMRQLSEPLIHDEILRIFLTSRSLSDKDFCERVKLNMDSWPAPHRDTLLHLLIFLHTVAQESENRMSVNSLAVVFGPNVFKLPDGPEAIQAQTVANNAFERLLSCSFLLSEMYQPPAVTKSPKSPPARPTPPVRRPLPSTPQEQLTPSVTLSPRQRQNGQKSPEIAGRMTRPVPAVRKTKRNQLSGHAEPLYYDIDLKSQSLKNGSAGDASNVLDNSEVFDSTSPPFTSPPTEGMTFQLNSKSVDQDDLSPRSKSHKSDSSEIPELIFECTDSTDDPLTNSCNSTGELKFADDSSAILEDAVRAVIRTRLFNSTESSSVSDDAERATGLLSSTTADRDRGPRNRRKPTRVNKLLHNVQLENSGDEDDDTIATPTNSDITTARSCAVDSVITVLTPTATDGIHFMDNGPVVSDSSTGVGTFASSPVLTTVTTSSTTVTTPDSGCVVDDYPRNSSPITTELSQANGREGSSPVYVPKLNLRNSFDEDDFPREIDTAVPPAELVPQLDLSSVTESVDREITKSVASNHVSHADKESTPPRSPTKHQANSKPVAKKKKKRQAQGKKPSKTSPGVAAHENNCEVIEGPEETLEEVKDRIAQVLRDNRRIAGRPYDVTKMAVEELKEEKLSMQRELLKYESRYGRPTTKDTKQIMREIYDRYRAVKRLLVANGKDENENTVKQDLNESFLLTRPLQNDLTSCDDSDVTHDGTLDTPTSDLLTQLRELRVKRKRLRRILRDFENKRSQENPALERRIMRSEYEEYKMIKSKVRELEIALAKKGVEIF